MTLYDFLLRIRDICEEIRHVEIVKTFTILYNIAAYNLNRFPIRSAIWLCSRQSYTATGERSRRAIAPCDVIRVFRPLHTDDVRILYELRDRQWGYKRNMQTLSHNHCRSEKIVLHILSVSVSTLSYPAGKAHVSYSVVMHGLCGFTIFFHIIS